MKNYKLTTLKIFIVSLLTIAIAGCMSSKTFSEQYDPIDHSQITEIKINTSLGNKHTTIAFTNKDSIKDFVTSLNASKVDGPWKGAQWDKILLIGKSDTISINTNGKVFGLVASGQFYKLDKKYNVFWKQ